MLRPMKPQTTEGIAAIKARIHAVFKRVGPPRPVGRTRFRVGIGMLLASTLPILLNNYLPFFVDVTIPRGVLIGGDALFIASFFVLGADWWERLKRLFSYQPAEAPSAGA